MILSVVIITLNEEENLARTLQSVQELVSGGKGEIIVLDSGSTDRTVEIAREWGAKVFVEPWRGFSAQKNSAIDKASGDWILSLDADEEVSPQLSSEIRSILNSTSRSIAAFELPRKNLFLGRWIKHGGFYPDAKIRFFARGAARFEERPVHEVIRTEGRTARLTGPLIHHAYPTLSGYIDHMNRYSSLGAGIAASKGRVGFSLLDIVFRPVATFFYNYVVRLGFLDGREGLLVHLYHSVYVSWKYAKLWELDRSKAASK